jgi:hypothetical protein
MKKPTSRERRRLFWNIVAYQFPAAVPLTLPIPEPVPGCAPVGLASWALAESGLTLRTMPVRVPPFFVGGMTAVEDVPPTTEPDVEVVWEPVVLCAKAAVMEAGAISSADDKRRECRRRI